MVEHVQLGTEVLSLDFDSLLCEHCKAKIEAAREAKRALQTFNELVSGRSAPPRAEPQVPGTKLTRDERLAKAQRLLAASGAVPAAPALPKGATQTSNGTILAQPWQHLPRKQIKKGAEADLHKVVSGKMTKKAWIEKHGYTASLLNKRLSMMAPESATEKKHSPPPSYAPPKTRLSDEDMLRVLRGEITGNRLAKELDMPTGSVYRLVEANRTRLSRTKGFKPGRATPNKVVIVDEDWRALHDGDARQRDIAQKYNVSPGLVYARYRMWAAAMKLEPRMAHHSAANAIRIDDKDLLRVVNDRSESGAVARKYNCSVSNVQNKAREFAVRYGASEPDDDELAEQIVADAHAPSDEHVGELFDKLGGATTE